MKIAILKGNGLAKPATKAKKIKSIEKKLARQFAITTPAKADLLVVLGGDGLMTRMAKKYGHLEKPFYGINCGSLGFLLNEHSAKDNFEKEISQAEFTDFPLIKAAVHLQSGVVKKALAFNDIYTKTTTAQGAKHLIRINGHSILGAEPFSGDGIIICTPGGSTAYSHAAGGIVLDHQAYSMGLTPIAPFRPIGFKAQLIPGNSIVELEMLEDDKRKHLVVADNISFRKVHKVIVQLSDKKVVFGFKEGNSYFRKTLKLRFPWLD